jgi:membrane-associated phospholipid phosphatase
MKRYAVATLLGLMLVALLLPFDHAISQALSWRSTGGDLRRTLETLQQYGDVGTLTLVSAIIYLLDPARRRRLLDLYLAAGATALACLALKILIGRPRPDLDKAWSSLEKPWTFLGPTGMFPLRGPDGVIHFTHTWDLGHHGVSDLWSMPSSHTAAATALSLFLIHIYPRLRPFAIVMVLIVAFGRVATGAHYPSDLLAGALVGYLVARPIVRSAWLSQMISRKIGDRG